jgi:acetyl esterase/lipase
VRDLAPVDLEAEYDNRANVPDHPVIMAGWERDAAAYRADSASRSELSLRYGPHPRHTMDLFHPERSEAQSPIVVFVHGGYWRSLGPELFSHLRAARTRTGFRLLCRLSPLSRSEHR